MMNTSWASTAAPPETDPRALIAWATALLTFALAAAVAATIQVRRGRSPFLAQPRPLAFGLVDLLAVLVLSYLVGGMAMALLAPALGIAPHGDDPPPSATVILCRALLSQALTLAPPALFFVMRTRSFRALEPHASAHLESRPRLAARGAVCGLLMFVGVTIVSGLTVEIGKDFGSLPPESGHTMLDAMGRSGHVIVIAGLMVSALVVAPVLEETFYRGIIQTACASITGLRRVDAVVLTSLLFAAAHASAVPWQMLPGLFVVSVAFGWLYERTGSLLAPICAHAAFNAVNLGFYLAVV